MYDTEEPALRRILAMILWVVVAVAIVWAVVWFVFFRSHPQQPSTNGNLTHKNTTSQTKPQGQAPQSPQSPSSSSPTSQAAGDAGSTLGSGSSTAQTPPVLANTGAGDVFVPFALATVAGSALYYVRLRKKLTQ